MLNVLEFCVSPAKIDAIYEHGFTHIVLEEELPINSYIVLRSEINPKTTAMARHMGGGVFAKLHNIKSPKGVNIQPRDARQNAFADALSNPDIMLSVAVGTAGTGKTTLALAHAAQRFLELGKPIYMTKPTETVGRGKAFGPVPGDIDEKYAPYLASYEIVLKKVLGADNNTKSFITQMKEKEHLKYIPIELVRGCTFERCTFIIDEAQNMDWHELNTVISRMGEDTECIILGDLYQIDTKMKQHETGLFKLINSKAFEQSTITSGIMLKTQYRSPITKLIAEIDKELNDKKE